MFTARVETGAIMTSHINVTITTCLAERSLGFFRGWFAFVKNCKTSKIANDFTNKFGMKTKKHTGVMFGPMNTPLDGLRGVLWHTVVIILMLGVA